MRNILDVAQPTSQPIRMKQLLVTTLSVFAGGAQADDMKKANKPRTNAPVAK